MPDVIVFQSIAENKIILETISIKEVIAKNKENKWLKRALIEYLIK